MSNFQLIQCLQGVAQRGTGARSNELNWPTAGKTGTTVDHTDAWYVGFSTRIVCGTWVGLDAKKTIYRGGADGAHVALPIWIDFMRAALPTTPREDFPVPEGMEWAEIDRLTGAVATSATAPSDLVRLAFKPGAMPKVASTPDLIQQIKEARGRANEQALEHRAWGASPAAEKPAEAEAAEDPNGK
jgi:penicillin-binding protein 1A